MRKLLATALLVFMLPTITLAADFNSSGNVSKTEKPKNLYTAGEKVNIDADVSGDLVTAGGDVFVNGNIEDSLLSAGGTVTIKGNIGRNAKVAGGTVTINGSIGSDLVVLGGDIIIGPESVITGDLIMLGGTINLDGHVKGKVYGSGGDIRINGAVDSDVDLENIGTLTLGGKASIAGNLKYSASEKATMDTGSTVKGSTDFTKVKTSQTGPQLDLSWFLFVLLGMLGSFIAIFILFLLFPKKTQTFVEKSFSSVWASMGIGLLALISVPVLVVIGFISNVGTPLSVLVLFFFIALLLLAGLMTSLLVGSLAKKLFSKSDVFETNWITIAVGVAIVGLLNILPFVGGLLVFGFFLIAVGSSIIQLFQVSKLEK